MGTSITTCSGRKKRAINMDGKLSPKDAAPVELEPSQREQDASAPAIDGSREGRFLLYWITTTSISTSTSFTTTYSGSVPSALLLVPTFVDRPITTKSVYHVQYIWDHIAR